MNFHQWQLPNPLEFIVYKYGCSPMTIHCVVTMLASDFVFVHFLYLSLAITCKKTNFSEFIFISSKMSAEFEVPEYDTQFCRRNLEQYFSELCYC